MLELSIALVIIASIAGWLCNKWLDQRQALNTNAAEAALTELLEERLKAFDGHELAITRLVNDVNTLKLQRGFKPGLDK